MLCLSCPNFERPLDIVSNFVDRLGIGCDWRHADDCSFQWPEPVLYNTVLAIDVRSLKRQILALTPETNATAAVNAEPP